MYKKLILIILFFVISFFAFYFINKKESFKIDDSKNQPTNNITNIVKETTPKVIKEIENDDKLKNYLLGKQNLSTEKNFITVPSKYTGLSTKIYLRNEAYQSFIKMTEAASIDNINLKIISGFRSFNYQKNIWENKWTGKTLVEGKNLSKSTPDELERANKILEYSAMPSASRHHWGSDIDINSVDPSYFEKEQGQKEYDWLVKNASKFGFCQPYTKKDYITRKTGYSEEKWHWSYKPISKELTNDYALLLKDTDIQGFKGDRYTTKISIIKNYVLGVNSDCLN